MKHDTVLADTVFAKATTITTGASAALVYSDLEFWVRFVALCCAAISGMLATIAWTYAIQNRKLEQQERKLRIKELEDEVANGKRSNHN